MVFIIGSENITKGKDVRYREVIIGFEEEDKMTDDEARELAYIFEKKGEFNQEGGERPILTFRNLDEEEAKKLEKFGANRYPKNPPPNLWVIQNKRDDKSRVRTFIEKLESHLVHKAEAAKIAIKVLDINEDRFLSRNERRKRLQI